MEREQHLLAESLDFIEGVNWRNVWGFPTQIINGLRGNEKHADGYPVGTRDGERSVADRVRRFLLEILPQKEVSGGWAVLGTKLALMSMPAGPRLEAYLYTQAFQLRKQIRFSERVSSFAGVDLRSLWDYASVTALLMGEADACRARVLHASEMTPYILGYWETVFEGIHQIVAEEGLVWVDYGSRFIFPVREGCPDTFSQTLRDGKVTQVAVIPDYLPRMGWVRDYAHPQSEGLLLIERSVFAQSPEDFARSVSRTLSHIAGDKIYVLAEGQDTSEERASIKAAAASHGWQLFFIQD